MLNINVKGMVKEERKVVYNKALVATRKVIDKSVMLISLKIVEDCPSRIVKSGGGSELLFLGR